MIAVGVKCCDLICSQRHSAMLAEKATGLQLVFHLDDTNTEVKSLAASVGM